MAVEFNVTLAQRMHVHQFPFDRQIFKLKFFLRGNFRKPDLKSSPWHTPGGGLTAITGYPASTTTQLSPAVTNYKLETPWVSRTEGSYVVDIRVQRQGHDLWHSVLPLFVFVTMGLAGLGLEPHQTSERLTIAAVTLLAVSSFVLNIQEKKQQALSKLDRYSTVCLMVELFVVGESLFVKQVLKGGLDFPWRGSQRRQQPFPLIEPSRDSEEYLLAEWVDLISITGVAVLWCAFPCLRASFSMSCLR